MKLIILCCVIVIMFTIGLTASVAGFMVNGNPYGGSADLGDAAAFLAYAAIFSVDGVPAFLSACFLAIDIVVLIIIFMILRGV